MSHRIEAIFYFLLQPRQGMWTIKLLTVLNNFLAMDESMRVEGVSHPSGIFATKSPVGSPYYKGHIRWPRHADVFDRGHSLKLGRMLALGALVGEQANDVGTL